MYKTLSTSAADMSGSASRKLRQSLWQFKEKAGKMTNQAYQMVPMGRKTNITQSTPLGAQKSRSFEVHPHRTYNSQGDPISQDGNDSLGQTVPFSLSENQDKEMQRFLNDAQSQEVRPPPLVEIEDARTISQPQLQQQETTAFEKDQSSATPILTRSQTVRFTDDIDPALAQTLAVVESAPASLGTMPRSSSQDETTLRKDVKKTRFQKLYEAHQARLDRLQEKRDAQDDRQKEMFRMLEYKAQQKAAPRGTTAVQVPVHVRLHKEAADFSKQLEEKRKRFEEEERAKIADETLRQRPTKGSSEPGPPKASEDAGSRLFRLAQARQCRLQQEQDLATKKEVASLIGPSKGVDDATHHVDVRGLDEEALSKKFNELHLDAGKRLKRRKEQIDRFWREKRKEIKEKHEKYHYHLADIPPEETWENFHERMGWYRALSEQKFDDLHEQAVKEQAEKDEEAMKQLYRRKPLPKFYKAIEKELIDKELLRTAKLEGMEDQLEAGGISVDDVLLAILHKLNERKTRGIDLFRKFDTSGDGSISQAELQEGLADMDFTASEHMMELLMARLDGDGSGDVELKELDRTLRHAEMIAESHGKSTKEAAAKIGLHNYGSHHNHSFLHHNHHDEESRATLVKRDDANALKTKRKTKTSLPPDSMKKQIKRRPPGKRPAVEKRLSVNTRRSMVQAKAVLMAIQASLSWRCGYQLPQLPQAACGELLGLLKRAIDGYQLEVDRLEEDPGLPSLKSRESLRFFQQRLIPEFEGRTGRLQPDSIRQVDDDIDRILKCAAEAHELLKAEIASKESWQPHHDGDDHHGDACAHPKLVPSALLVYDPGLKSREHIKKEALARFGPSEGKMRYRHMLDICSFLFGFSNCNALQAGLDAILQSFDVVEVRNLFSNPDRLGQCYIQVLVVVLLAGGEERSCPVPHVCEMRLELVTLHEAYISAQSHVQEFSKKLHALHSSTLKDFNAVASLVNDVLSRAATAQRLREFRTCLGQRFGSAICAWRHALDDGGRFLSFERFRNVCNLLNYGADVTELWQGLDAGRSGCISLWDLDPDSCALLVEFRARAIAAVDGSEDDFTARAIISKLALLGYRPRDSVFKEGHIDIHQFRLAAGQFGFSSREAEQCFACLAQRGGIDHSGAMFLKAVDIEWLMRLPSLIDIDAVACFTSPTNGEIESEAANDSGHSTGLTLAVCRGLARWRHGGMGAMPEQPETIVEMQRLQEQVEKLQKTLDERDTEIHDLQLSQPKAEEEQPDKEDPPNIHDQQAIDEEGPPDTQDPEVAEEEETEAVAEAVVSAAEAVSEQKSQQAQDASSESRQMLGEQMSNYPSSRLMPGPKKMRRTVNRIAAVASFGNKNSEPKSARAAAAGFGNKSSEPKTARVPSANRRRNQQTLATIRATRIAKMAFSPSLKSPGSAPSKAPGSAPTASFQAPHAEDKAEKVVSSSSSSSSSS